MVLHKIGSTTLPDRSSIRFTLAVAFLPTGIAAIFAVSGLGVDDLAAIFTLDSAHAGVTINEIVH